MSLRNMLSKKNRALMRELVVTDFKLRYQGSALGYVWSLLKPLFIFAILYFVFGLLIRFDDIQHYPQYLLLGVVLWGFFTEATGQGMNAIVGRGDLIRKINFPKYIIVISATVSAFINLLLNLAIVALFMVLGGIDLLHQDLLLFTLLILELYVLALSLAFFLSALFVRFRDIGYIWEIFIQAAFYLTPILYPMSEVIKRSELIAKLQLLNPVSQIIQDARFAVITHDATTIHNFVQGWWVLVPFLIVVVVAILAGLYFKKSAKYFAENV